jgi:hypothetical protein
MKLKPKWMKTDIPKDTKIKLWRIMRDNPNYNAWQQGIARVRYEFDEKEDKYIRLSRYTYKSLQAEVSLMPIEEVCSLPYDLQIWIQELRPELGEAFKTERNNDNIKQNIMAIRGELGLPRIYFSGNGMEF